LFYLFRVAAVHDDLGACLRELPRGFRAESL
jgi:hypothetical protein